MNNVCVACCLSITDNECICSRIDEFFGNVGHEDFDSETVALLEDFDEADTTEAVDTLFARTDTRRTG